MEYFVVHRLKKADPGTQWATDIGFNPTDDVSDALARRKERAKEHPRYDWRVVSVIVEENEEEAES
jgi:hypothetical protein